MRHCNIKNGIWGVLYNTLFFSCRIENIQDNVYVVSRFRTLNFFNYRNNMFQQFMEMKSTVDCYVIFAYY